MSDLLSKGLLSLGQGFYIPLSEISLISPAGFNNHFEESNVMDLTFRQKPRSIIWTNSEKKILSSLSPEEIAKRYSEAQ